jgi:hypothetical protein
VRVHIGDESGIVAAVPENMLMAVNDARWLDHIIDSLGETILD